MSEHWASRQERGNRFVLRLVTRLIRFCPAWLLAILSRIVVLYFYLTSPAERRNIAEYQQHLRDWSGRPELIPATLAVYRQFLAFGQALIDRFAVWQGRLRYEHIVIEDPDGIHKEMLYAKGRGQILICSHLGNTEISRALVSHHKGLVLNILIHSKHAQMYNEAMAELGADNDIRLLQVSELDIDTMMMLQQRVDNGEWIAIAADREPVRGEKVVPVPFLGVPVNFPQGPWLMAGLLKASVNTLFCTRHQGRYILRCERMSDRITWSRQDRDEVIQTWVQRYAAQLEKVCTKAPLQWFNFYDFWKRNE